MCAGPRFDAPPDPALVEAAGRHLRSTPIELEVRKMAPDAEGVMRKIPVDVLVEPGWALARFGDGGWWPAIERGLASGEFEDDVVQALADIVRAGGVDWVTSVPSVRLGDVLERLGRRLADALSVPYVALVTRVAERPPQREMANAAQQAANVRGAFRVVAHATARARRAARRPPDLGLDARDGRRPATPRRRRARSAARAGHSAVACSVILDGRGRGPRRGRQGEESMRRFMSLSAWCAAVALAGVTGGVAAASPPRPTPPRRSRWSSSRRKDGATAALVSVFIHGHLSRC